MGVQAFNRKDQRITQINTLDIKQRVRTLCHSEAYIDKYVGLTKRVKITVVHTKVTHDGYTILETATIGIKLLCNQHE